MSTQAILDKLNKVKGSKGKYRAQCPSHGSSGLTLQISERDDGSTGIYCYAGCSAEDVLAAINMPVSAMFGDSEYVKPSYTKKHYEKDLYDEFFYEIYKADVKKGIKPTEAETAQFRQIAERKFRRA